MGNCNKCGTQNRDGAKYCRNCGNPLEQKQKTRGGFGIPILAVFGILLAFGVIYALKGGLGEFNNEEGSGLNEDTTAVVEKDNNKLPAPVRKLLDEDMVYVEGGSFMMLLEKRVYNEDYNYYETIEEEKEETVSGFYICKYEVTQELWLAVMGNNPSHYSKAWGYSDDFQRPVESIGLQDCKAFIEKLIVLTGKHFRLPSFAEWQFAAKGGNKSKGYKYAGSNNLDEVAWFTYFDDLESNEQKSPTHRVGSKKANELGLYDMNGNVREVTSDIVKYNNDFGDFCHYFCGGAWNDGVSIADDNSSFRVNSFVLVFDDNKGDPSMGLRLAMSDDD